MFDVKTLNEDIPQSDKRFTKRNVKLCNVSKYYNQSSLNSQIQYYELKKYAQSKRIRVSFTYSF